jgi:hypothetical protein
MRTQSLITKLNIQVRPFRSMAGFELLRADPDGAGGRHDGLRGVEATLNGRNPMSQSQLHLNRTVRHRRAGVGFVSMRKIG